MCEDEREWRQVIYIWDRRHTIYFHYWIIITSEAPFTCIDFWPCTVHDMLYSQITMSVYGHFHTLTTTIVTTAPIWCWFMVSYGCIHTDLLLSQLNGNVISLASWSLICTVLFTSDNGGQVDIDVDLLITCERSLTLQLLQPYLFIILFYHIFVNCFVGVVDIQLHRCMLTRSFYQEWIRWTATCIPSWSSSTSG